MQKQVNSAQAASTVILNDVAMLFVAVMKNSCAHNIVVLSPTTEPSRVIPATLITINESMNLTNEEIIKILLSSEIVGAFIANQITFGEEVTDCQDENGAASCVNAAGVAQLLGEIIEQTFQVTSIAM